MKQSILLTMLMFVLSLHIGFSQIRIAPNTNITVESGTTVKATGDGLILESDDSGDVSLIVSGTGAVSGTIQAQRYMPGVALSWHLIGAPVGGMDIKESNFNPTASDDFYSWHEPGIWLNIKSSQDYSNGQNAFYNYNNESFNFLPAKGYLVAYNEANPTKTFQGGISSGAISFTLKYSVTKDWVYTPGWNILANPYTSAIDWNLANRSDFQDNYAYIYNPNKEGGEGYDQIDGTIENSIIAANQGFFVIAKSDANDKEFTFTDALQTHQRVGFMKSSTVQDALIMRLASGDYYDEASIRINENSSFDRDRSDALKLFSFSEKVPQVYSISQDGINLAINSIPHADKGSLIPLGVKLTGAEKYSLSVQMTQNFFTVEDIYIIDHHKQVWHNINEGDYIFESPGEFINDRFALHIGQKDATDTDMHHYVALNAWVYDNQLTIEGTEMNVKLSLYDIHGRLVLSETINLLGSYTKTLNLEPGIYITRLQGEETSKTLKLFIK